jgi:hypothetical protein
MDINQTGNESGKSTDLKLIKPVAYPEFWASLIFLLLPVLWFWVFFNGWGTAKTVSRIHEDCLVSVRLGFLGDSFALAALHHFYCGFCIFCHSE